MWRLRLTGQMKPFLTYSSFPWSVKRRGVVHCLGLVHLVEPGLASSAEKMDFSWVNQNNSTIVFIKIAN